MKICALYICWYDGIEILPFSVAQIKDLVDEVIVVYSNTSNWGDHRVYVDELEGLGTLMNWEPDPNKPAQFNECAKRNFALDAARALGYTHFVMMDCDEIYEKDEFKHDRDIMFRTKMMDGLVCALKVYVRKPTLVCDDHTIVPFIHRLTPKLKFELGWRGYPFAYDKDGHAHIDPTRRLNISSGVMMSGSLMHHYSHVRKNIQLKMDNSSARRNLTQSTLLEDYQNAKPGYWSKFYRQELKEVPNRFNIQF